MHDYRNGKQKDEPLTLLVPSPATPWTWNLVLITSRGQTNVAAITPATNPHTTSMEESEITSHLNCNSIRLHIRADAADQRNAHNARKQEQNFQYGFWLSQRMLEILLSSIQLGKSKFESFSIFVIQLLQQCSSYVLIRRACVPAAAPAPAWQSRPRELGAWWWSDEDISGTFRRKTSRERRSQS